MKNWLSEKLDKISKFDSYNRPNKNIGSLKLDANENFALKKKFILDIAIQAAKVTDLREYPLDQFQEIYRQLAKYTGINKKYLAVGNGSDQIIELILSIIGKGQRVTIFTPTFSYFINRCKLHELTVYRVPLSRENNTLHKIEFLESAKLSDIVYICSPNNPTGNQFDKQMILEIIDSLQDKLILLDEAYVEFADYSLLPYAPKYDNVIILRTLSKAFGLAGARVGYLVANERFAQVFRSSIQSPYPLNSLSLTIAGIVLSQYNYVNKTIKMIKEERTRVFYQLARLQGIKPFESNANFIFFESFNKYEAILKSLKKERLVVKAFGNVEGRKGCIRVTIGTKNMNDKFLQSIEKSIP
ncbi:MAG TPA: histidinol-phosphate transaminase [Nitrososphaeraceae archaeon]|jgi:histidinol-phosphate aminotransferase|nr:histidinol-phosphate transaminase [Nitrososphaeraceae archaeon]